MKRRSIHQNQVCGGRRGLAAMEVVLTLAAMLPIAVVVFVMTARLARWFYFLVVHSVGSPLF